MPGALALGFIFLIMPKDSTMPVLLFKAYEEVSVNPGAKETFNFSIEKDRGTVNYVDFTVPYPDDPTNDQPFRFTLKAGGQELTKDDNQSNYAYYMTRGRDEEERIRILLADRQRFELFVDNTLVGLPALARIQLLTFYTTEAHQYFLKNFKWKFGLGLKKQSFLLTVTTADVPGAIPPKIVFTLPKFNNDVIALSMTSATNSAIIVGSRDFFVRENGVLIIDNYNGTFMLPNSGRRDWVFKKRISGGSAIEFICVTRTTPIANEFYFITFYFDN